MSESDAHHDGPYGQGIRSFDRALSTQRNLGVTLAYKQRLLMSNAMKRRQFVQAAAMAGASFAFLDDLFAVTKKSVLMFTKSSGFEHEVVKTPGGKPGILEIAVTMLGEKHGFDVTATKDGRV